jgi:hypothetical protein
MKKNRVMVYSYFSQDARSSREVEDLIKESCQVDILCLRMFDQSNEESIFGVNTYRVNISTPQSSKRKYITLCTKFFILSFFKLNQIFLKNRYNVIHV